MEGTNFKDFKKELLKETGVRTEYLALDKKYEIIQTIIAFSIGVPTACMRNITRPFVT